MHVTEQRLSVHDLVVNIPINFAADIASSKIGYPSLISFVHG